MARLSAAQVEQFRREGYLVVPGLFDPVEDLDPLIHEYEFVLDNLARELLAQGQITSTPQESSEESTAERSQPEDWTTESRPADSLAAMARSHSAAHADSAARSLAALPIP